MKINIDVDVSKWQKAVYEAFEKYRFVVVSAGRQSGKTFLGVLLLLKKAQKEKSINWWVSPTYANAGIAFRRLLDILAQAKGLDLKINRTELSITFPNGARIVCKSADREEGLRGETVNCMVVDEMGLIKRDAWQYALRGTITITQAPVLFIGTPKGKNLFYELYMMGMDAANKEYKSFQFSSKDSPFFSSEEWAAVNTLPERIFRQEYMAEFLDDGGEVFRNVRGCVQGSFQKVTPQKSYYAGVDLAKSVDFTVICIMDNLGHVVAWERFKDIAWTVQKERIYRLCSEYNAYTLIDSTGVGDPVYDDLCRAGLTIDGFLFNNTSKRQLIENLAIAIERNEVTFPEIPELINELNVFTFEQLPSGLLRYGAPEGLHDDCVIGLALAYKAQGGKASVFDYHFGPERETSKMTW